MSKRKNYEGHEEGHEEESVTEPEIVIEVNADRHADVTRKCFSPMACEDQTPGHACGVKRNPHVDKTAAAKVLRK